MLQQQTELDVLFDTIKQWAGSQEGWTVAPDTIKYTLPESREVMDLSGLHLYTPQGRIHIEPRGRRRDGSNVVEVYAWPTLIRVYLVHKPGGEWQVFTDAMLPFRLEWNEANFVRLVQDLQVLP